MKKVILTVLSISPLLFNGCSSVPFPPGSSSQLGSDNALLEFKYGGIYGPVTVIRANPKPGQTVTYNGSDGSFTMGNNGSTNSASISSNSVVIPTSAKVDLSLHQ